MWLVTLKGLAVVESFQKQLQQYLPSYATLQWEYAILPLQGGIFSPLPYSRRVLWLTLAKRMSLYDLQIKALRYYAISVFTFLEPSQCHVRIAQCSLVDDDRPYGKATWRIKIPQSTTSTKAPPVELPQLTPCRTEKSCVHWALPKFLIHKSLAVICLVVFLSRWV